MLLENGRSGNEVSAWAVRRAVVFDSRIFERRIADEVEKVCRRKSD
jgi:hypothetical protein